MANSGAWSLWPSVLEFQDPYFPSYEHSGKAQESVTTPVVGFFPESESSFGTGRVGESAEGRGVVKSCDPASLLQSELLKAVCTRHYSWPFTPLRTLSVEPANNNKKTPKSIQANWPNCSPALYIVLNQQNYWTTCPDSLSIWPPSLFPHCVSWPCNHWST